jgi:hypothetical protein
MAENNNNNNNNPGLKILNPQDSKAAAKLDKEVQKHLAKEKELTKKGVVFPVNMWALVDPSHPDTPITFAATETDIHMALDQFLYLKHYSHFRNWCPLHNLPVDHGESWLRYCREVIYPEEELNSPSYVIYQIKYEPNVIASLLRIMNHCVPMGLPMDTKEEIDTFCDRAETLPPEELTPIERSLIQYLDDIEDHQVEGSQKVLDRAEQIKKEKEKDGTKKYDA